MINASNISLKIADRKVLRNVDFQLSAGEFVGLIGANGAGKTSLLRSLLGLQEGAKGECALWKMKPKERARFAAWLAQEREVSWTMPVQEVVGLGRLPWRGFLDKGRAYHEAIVKNEMERMDVAKFAARPFASLSGGERAKVLIARLLAQDTPFLFADEPIAALDPGHQLMVMDLFQSLAHEGRGVIASLHDLGLAARFCDRLILIDDGEILAEGAVAHVLSDENIALAYGVRLNREQTSRGMIITPIERIENDAN